ncbi:MAG TPA: efflux RND transporter periplasmic adaptor subunit [Candidatus Acidoferrum sp.]|nr:efflux RND transporter periplasmic adaptor subunit [Candidatus Acidoferrum sp.]
MNRRNQPLTLPIILCFVASGGLSSCSNERQTQAAAPETVSNVSVIVAQTTTAPDWLEAVGTVRAAQTSQVASQMMGDIVEIRAHEGDRVQSGQVLAVLNDAQPRSGTDQATAALNVAEKEVSAADSDFALAEATLNRYQQLYEKKSVSPQEFDEIKGRYQSAEARRDMARAGQAQANAALTQAHTSLGYTRIRAPFPGVVTEKKADAGTLASPGTPMFTIEDTRSYRLEVTVDESDLRLVHVGQVSPVTIDALGNVPLSGKVVQIVPAADPASRSFLVKIELPADARLRSGLFGRARFPRGERPTLLVPHTSLVERGQLQGVYVLDANQIAGLRYVTIGKSAGEQIEVLSGLQGGEKLVAVAGDRDLSGKRIAIRP